MCGVSQRRLAEISGMSLNRVGIVLRGETPPASVGEVGALSTALGLTVAEVLREAEATERGGDDVERAGLEEWAVAAHDPGTDPEAEAEAFGAL